jgi:serine/threonine protein kinase
MINEMTNFQPLGAGGYGDVFLGWRWTTNEWLSVKILRDFQLADARKGFAREVRILSRRRVGVVQAIFADTQCEQPYYVMPYFPGGSLTAHAGKLSASQLHNVTTELANVFAQLHSESIWHGDFNPDNVFVSMEGRLHVGDPLGNGAGCTVFWSVNSGGTPGFWAPEIRLNRAAISRESDMYSFGATVFHLASGERPVDGIRLDLEAARLNVSDSIRDVIVACCQINPGARANIDDVLRMLQGERWTDIQAQRARERDALATAAVVVGGILLAAWLFGGEGGE